MMILIKKYTYILNMSCLLIVLMVTIGCDTKTKEVTSISSEVKTIDSEETLDRNIVNWTEATHSNNVDPNYDVVFNQTEVMVLDIRISEENWAAMQSDLDAKFGGANFGRKDDLYSSFGYTPIWVESSITYDGNTWNHVGIRFKGNSSLLFTYLNDNNKLSFKLDFDEFEDDYPENKNQRFYGFKQLNLANNFQDQSLMREKVAADLFREFGVISSETAFCVINLDYGEGSLFYGVYTLVEEMDDTTIETQTGNDLGNLYKPDGATYASKSYDEEDMIKKSNEEEADYSDVLALYEILNNKSRKSDNLAWKSELEKVFNVDNFIKWLAVNTVIQNWDTYGNMPHNYYLYSDPITNQLNWIPWDNSEAFKASLSRAGILEMGFAAPMISSSSLPLDLSLVKKDWPLISYIIEVPEYKNKYDVYLEEFVEKVYNTETMNLKYEFYYELLKEYADREREDCTFLTSDIGFDNAVETMKLHVAKREKSVDNYLNNQ